MDTNSVRESHKGGSLTAGRELDKRISVEYLNEPFDPNSSYPWDGIHPYSTNIVAAWQIWLGLLRKRPMWVLGMHQGWPTVFSRPNDVVIAQGDSFEEVICRAALKFSKERRTW